MALQGKSTYSSELFYKDGNFNKPTELLLDYKKIMTMNYGSARRELILKVLQTNTCFRVNRKYCIQTKTDPDIKRLIKQGKIEIFNQHNSYGIKHTYLRLKTKK